jgi:hypothetical protein
MEEEMRLIHKVCTICAQGASCYFIGDKLEGGVIDLMEDESWLSVEGIYHVHIDIYSKDNVIARLINVPVEIEYESEKVKKR